MKYMRVYDAGNFDGNKEEGIYKIKQYLGMSNCYECYDSNNERHLFDYRAGKVADTIEELCDLYIYVDKFDNSHRLVGENELRMFNEFFGDVGIIYGAIWTDKGLIYVAKMNDKGELELL